MHSCLYECQVMHHRYAPKVNHFAYRIFLLSIDLDELDDLHRNLRLLSVDERNLYSFRQKDYLPVDGPIHPSASGIAAAPCSPPATLKKRVADYLLGHGIVFPLSGRIALVTLPRVFGYLFNPVSFYFCSDANGDLLAIIAEVTNTFREVKPFVIRRPEGDSLNGSTSALSFQLRTPKSFYVSPYSDVDVEFAFKLRPLDENLSAQIDDYAGTQRLLTSTLQGQRHPLNDFTLAWFSLKYPLITLKIIGLIHWQALILYVRHVRWFAKTHRAADQRGIFRPHISIVRPPGS